MVALLFARRGFNVDVYEKRTDFRKEWGAAKKEVRLVTCSDIILPLTSAVCHRLSRLSNCRPHLHTSFLIPSLDPCAVHNSASRRTR